MSLSPQRTTPITVKTQRRAHRKMPVYSPQMTACELGIEFETNHSLSFIEALIGDG